MFAVLQSATATPSPVIDRPGLIVVGLLVAVVLVAMWRVLLRLLVIVVLALVLIGLGVMMSPDPAPAQQAPSSVQSPTAGPETTDRAEVPPTR